MKMTTVLVAVVFQAASLDVLAGPTVSLGELTKRALENPMTLQTGILGQDAVELRRVTRSTGGEIVASAQTIKLFKQEGCGRVRVLVSVPHVPTSGGHDVTYLSGTEMNLCRDGRPVIDSDSNSSTTPERE